MPRLPLSRRLLWAHPHFHTQFRPPATHQVQQRRSVFMPVIKPSPPRRRTINFDLPNHDQPLIKPRPSLYENPDLVEVCAAPASPSSPGSPSNPSGLPPDLEEKFVSLDYALSVLDSLMTLAEKDRDDHGFSLGPLSNKGTVAMQGNSDKQDCIEMTAMIIGKAKRTWKPIEADDIRKMYMVEKTRKGRMGRGNSNDRLLEELLIHDIARRVAPSYQPQPAGALSLKLDNLFPDFDLLQDAIWPAYETARQRQGFKEELDDLTLYEKSMMDFYV
ncbi:hypothetical protein QBC40DRAFT_300400 [Triangularia verruculosa]|uniref:Uncharacterized protein n=1 Tax=Triangularia verruculosa TaxID=2587418 RepID=A0AAN6X959_9PEZI|nr:hypothetical protein QBC40DRAFT_300400 [Triangularia verruculosa]